MIKIKSINLNGFRGVRDTLQLKLESKSILLFGENGAGKSSITDAFEWFYNDCVKHLTCEEIEKKGLSALRNIFIANTGKSSVEISFTENKYDSQKNINIKKTSLETTNSNTSEDFLKYIENSSSENLFLRYEDLTEFVLSTKKEKLDSLSRVIGFAEVSNVRGVLKKAVNELKSILKVKSFENEISRREGDLFSRFNERIMSDDQYFKKINDIIMPLGMNVKIEKFEDLDELLASLKKSDDSSVIEQRAFYNETISKISKLRDQIALVPDVYDKFFLLVKTIVDDVDALNKIALNNLWSEGLKVLKGSTFEKNKCPLCFQDKDSLTLIKDTESRIKTLESIKKQQKKLEIEIKNIKDILEAIKNTNSGINSSKYFSLDDNKIIKDFCSNVSEYIDLINSELNVDLSKGKLVKTREKILYSSSKIDEVLEFCKQRNSLLAGQLKGNKIMEAQDIIMNSRKEYNEIKKLKTEKEIVEKQRNSLELIYDAFIAKQKKELEVFVSTFSKEISDYYQYMHPGEKVEDIEIKLAEKDDELTGITIDFKFFHTTASPPQKYLSESHLNCLGIAFFLASVKAFNKQNGFFIIDDIISSFDSNHRMRLGELFLEKFPDYQIILLTHERNWFDYMKNRVRREADWDVDVISWNEARGTHLNETLVDLKRIIENKFANNDKIGLGNIIRKYLESFLKEICENLKVRVEYRSNDANETRMSNELISNLKSKINKQPCKNDFDKIIEKMIPSIFIGNKDSHDGGFDPSIGECRTFWQDVVDLEKLFRCGGKCGELISQKHYDSVEKKIRCSCGKLKYDWSS
jgi:recombinational DNA repair ATPase RecF